MDLCREILRQIADSPKEVVEAAVEGRSDDEIAYQMHIMVQANLIEAVVAKNGRGGVVYRSMGLTWKGNEFLDAARDDTVWTKAKARFAKAGGAFTFDLLLAVCKAVISERTGLPL